jgi:hypothetical protein
MLEEEPSGHPQISAKMPAFQNEPRMAWNERQRAVALGYRKLQLFSILHRLAAVWLLVSVAATRSWPLLALVVVAGLELSLLRLRAASVGLVELRFPCTRALFLVVVGRPLAPAAVLERQQWALTASHLQDPGPVVRFRFLVMAMAMAIRHVPSLEGLRGAVVRSWCFLAMDD